MRDDSDGKPTAYSVKRDMRDAALQVLKESEKLSLISTYPDLLKEMRDRASAIFDSTHESPNLYPEPIAEQIPQLTLGLKHAIETSREAASEKVALGLNDFENISSLAITEDDLRNLSVRVVDAMARAAVVNRLRFQHPQDADKYNKPDVSRE
ncbi:MAG: hypothetical protein ABL983_10805 [Nitrospira sp.]|jgi:hypothetical protein